MRQGHLNAFASLPSFHLLLRFRSEELLSVSELPLSYTDDVRWAVPEWCYARTLQVHHELVVRDVQGKQTEAVQAEPPVRKRGRGTGHSGLGAEIWNEPKDFSAAPSGIEIRTNVNLD